MKWPWLALLIVGCGGDGDTHHVTVPDAGVDGSIDPVRTNTLYLNFEGVTLAPGADDATQNTSTIATGPTTLPSYLGSAADRATTVAAIAAEVGNILEPYDVEIVTSRPGSGSYMMIVTTDAPSTTLGCTDCPALANDDCGSVESPVAFNFGGGSAQPIHGLTADTIAMVGLSVLGIPTSAVPDDCMCFADANCTFPPDRQCSIGGAGTAISTAKPGCQTTETVMDENAQFLAGFGPHP
jgi:hypothetical protein